MNYEWEIRKLNLEIKHLREMQDKLIEFIYEIDRKVAVLEEKAKQA